MKLNLLFALWALVAIVGSYFLGYTPLIIAVLYFAFSLLAIVAYAKDKSAAKKKQWRVPENTLHVLALCGGWLGAAVAQEQFRHKTQKTSFLMVFWLTVVLNSALFVGLHMAPASDILRQVMSSAERTLIGIGGRSAGVEALGSLFRYRAY